jgi:hypothetical protein
MDRRPFRLGGRAKAASLLVACIAVAASSFVIARELAPGGSTDARSAASDGSAGSLDDLAPAASASAEGTPAAVTPAATPYIPQDPAACEALAENEVLACLWNYESNKPPFEGVINGITLYDRRSGVEVGELSACAGGPDEVISPAEIADSPLVIAPAYLPDGVADVTNPPYTGGVICGGELVWNSREWFGATDGGGGLLVARYHGAPEAVIDFPEDRLGPCTIREHAAVCGQPILEEGFGPSLVVVREPFGVTTIEGMNLPLDELVAVAESLD